MPAIFRLKDIVDALEMLDDEYLSHFDLDTGEVHTLERSLLSEAEDFEDDEEDEHNPEWDLAIRIVSSDRFVRLPTKADIDEWAIRNEFSDSFPKARIREELLDAIRGAGAFRAFKIVIRRHNIESDWYAFREKALTEIARDWCEENDIPWKK